MSLLDKVKGLFTGGGEEEGAQSGHLAALFGSLLGDNSAGLKSIVDQFKAAGLQEIVASWVGKGKNLPVNAEQVKAALGSKQLKALAAKVGLPTDKVAELLARHLPGTVDKLTPDGRIPDEDDTAEW
ncbi:MAG TPA: YidB family protein [Gemmataceae bacterium]|nr:YidB family protein [Gemmataceae bacterium]